MRARFHLQGNGQDVLPAGMTPGRTALILFLDLGQVGRTIVW